MGILYLVRHGQASFGAADYDRLSELGTRQCTRLGQWWRSRGVQFDAVLTGTLKRQGQSLAAIESGLGATCGEALQWPGLNEYDSHAVVRALHGELPPAPTTPEQRRQYFALLRQGLAAWMAGRTQPEGMPAHAEFLRGVVGALDHVRTHHARQRVLIVSSGGPIAHALGHVLGLADNAVIDLNMQIRNSAVCELKVSARRMGLVTFNELPHLHEAEHQSWMTWA